MSAVGPTGIEAIDQRLEAMLSVPPGSVARRFGYVGLLTVGIFMTAFGSYVFNQIPPIPLKFIPDLRIAFLLVSSLLIGLQAMGGSARRRAWALWGVIGYVLAFHLEEATVHWIGFGAITGSITGTRVGLIGTAGSILAILAVVLMHVEVERCHLRRDVLARGVAPASADALTEGLSGEGRRQAFGIAAGVAAMAVFLFIAEKPFGESGTGGSWVLLAGGGMMLAGALYLLRMLPGTSSKT